MYESEIISSDSADDDAVEMEWVQQVGEMVWQIACDHKEKLALVLLVGALVGGAVWYGWAIPQQRNVADAQKLSTALHDYMALMKKQEDERTAAREALNAYHNSLQHTTHEQTKQLRVLRKGKSKTFFQAAEIDQTKKVVQTDEQKNERARKISEMLKNYPRLPQSRKDITWREVERITKERAEHHEKLQKLVQTFLGEGHAVVRRSIDSRRNF